MRAAAAGLAGNRLIAIAAWHELSENFPDTASNLAEMIGTFFHFDRWEKAMLEGLEKAKALANAT